MIILIDLDGTLTNTAHPYFKNMKDGLEETDLSKIKVFDGAIDFIKNQKQKGNIPVIVSDSHPKYVNKIANEIFDIDAIYLTDKPNTEKFIEYFEKKHLENPKKYLYYKEKEHFIVIGDSWLDIEFGRKLNYPTVFTRFYKASAIEERDGIGQDWKPVKSGPTFYAKNFNELEEIIENPLKNLLAIEAIFQGQNSDKMVKFLYRNYSGNFTAFRCLARQEDGECDKFARADKYYQIDNVNRSPEFLKKLANGISNYLNRVAKYPEYNWHYLTYVSDKITTEPKNKMKEIFDLIDTDFQKIKIFEWTDKIEGKLREQPDYKSRREFISKHLNIIQQIDVKDKNIIIIDDQFTSSATANEISYQLRKNGARNILFVALFYLILPIVSKNCPKCGKPLKIKIRKADGNRFYSCVPAKYGGNGCGFTENIN